MIKMVILYGFFALFAVVGGLTDNCRVKEWIETGREVVNSQYVLQLSVVNTTGNEATYFPDTKYDIKIRPKNYTHKILFVEFYFTLWNKDESKSSGKLEIREDGTTTFSNQPFCKNRIIDGPSSSSRYSVKIGWQSPPRDSGCIELKAIVKETDLRYHVANLTVCEDERVKLDDPGQILRNCCVCYDGKYELTFEGLWSRYTHPKSFPLREWLAIFPTVLGVSHTHNYEFWHPYTMASEGLKLFAKTGRTVPLELELKKNRNEINSLIKFRGANFQNKSRKSFATLRVNKDKHVVSLVARIDPSPDWFVGMSSLELCAPGCNWIEKKVFNLYAWDAGARNGIIYEDLEEDTSPPDLIQRLNMTWPPPRNGVESPFYDKTNNTHDIRPLARLTFKLLHRTEKSCKKPLVDPEKFCYNDWSDWGPCSVDCGQGLQKRFRTKKEDYLEDDCEDRQEESQTCQGMKSECEKEVTEKDCELSGWNDWKPCKKTCGQETIKRSRNYFKNEAQCKEKFPANILEEEKDCDNPPCPNDEYDCPEDHYTNWSEWSACSVSGLRHRSRSVKKNLKITSGYSACLYQDERCDGTEDTTPESPGLNYNLGPTDPLPEFCFLDPEPGQCTDNRNENSIKSYYDRNTQKCETFSYSGCEGNENRFDFEKDCVKICGRKVNCVMSTWGPWSECQKCEETVHSKRTTLVQPQNGGKECPKFETIRLMSCSEVNPHCKKE